MTHFLKHPTIKQSALGLTAVLAAFAVTGCFNASTPNETAESAKPAADKEQAAAKSASVEKTTDWPQWGHTPSKNMAAAKASGLPEKIEAGDYKPGTEEVDMATTKNVRWVAKLGSQSYGNPSISNGKIVVGTNNESPRDPDYTEDRGVIMCLDEKTGELIWQLIIPKLGAGKVSDWEYIGICSSAAIEGDRAYVLTNRGEVACLDMNGLKDGNQGFQDEAQYKAGPGKPPATLKEYDADIIWKFDMREELGVFPHNITSCSAVIVGDILVTATSNGVDWSHTHIPNPNAPALIALDKNTGELIGEEASGISSRILHCNWASPAIGQIAGQQQIVWGAGDGFAYGFSTKTVEDEDGFKILPELWRFDLNPPEYRVDAEGQPIRYATFPGPSEAIGTAVIHDGIVFANIGQDPEHGDGVGALSAIDPSQVEEKDGVKLAKAKWVNKGVGRTMSTVSIHDGVVYCGEYAGIIHAIDVETGESLASHDTKSRMWGSTLYADGRIWVGNEDGDLVILKAAGKDMKLLDLISLGAPVYSSPVYANQTVYVASQTHLYAIGTTEE